MCKVCYFCPMETSKQNKKFSKDQIDKIGNTLIYIQSEIGFLAKTKALKLLYILDELSITKYGIPFVNLDYKVWRLGPVNPEMFIELSIDTEIGPTTNLLKDYIEIEQVEGAQLLKPLRSFNDDEFSDNDINLLQLVVKSFASRSATDLIEYTHRPNSLWDKVVKENNLEADLPKINTTEFDLKMEDLIKGDPFKLGLYNYYKELI